MAEHDHTAEALARITAFFSEAGAAPAADTVASLFARHLSAIEPQRLPAAAQEPWQRVAAQLAKAGAGKRLPPERVAAAIASWPAARVATLIESLEAVRRALEAAANDALADAANERVSRAYL
jgi:hypothetical protein